MVAVNINIRVRHAAEKLASCRHPKSARRFHTFGLACSRCGGVKYARSKGTGFLKGWVLPSLVQAVVVAVRSVRP